MLWSERGVINISVFQFQQTQGLSERGTPEKKAHAFVAPNRRAATKRHTAVDPASDDGATGAAGARIKGAVLSRAHADRRDGQMTDAGPSRRAVAPVVGARRTRHVAAKGKALARRAAPDDAVAETGVTQRCVRISNDCLAVNEYCL